MNDWKIFYGSQKPDNNNNGIKRLLTVEAPTWRKFFQESQKSITLVSKKDYWEELREIAQTKERDIQRGKTFRVRENHSEVIDAVNAALYLRRPLLITGKPGSGKTTIAYAIAYELQMGPVLPWSITTRSTLQEGLYQYDAIARLQDAQLSKTDPAATSVEARDYQDIGQYIQLGPMGTAFLPYKYPRVLLIDEIDKSDINLPNDLLNMLEEGKYQIPELVRLAKQHNQTRQKSNGQVVQSYDGLEVIVEGKVQCQAFPLIIMTSNGERDFPPAFLRRCLQVHMPEPTDADLQEIVKAHLGLEAVQQFQDIIKRFADKNESEEGNMATDQLLNSIYLLAQNADREKVEKLMFSSLNGVEGSE